MTMTATYSPEDNKLRLYSLTRLDDETYARVKEAGFRWAPKQELFVAPAWTPQREDLCIELAGEIEPEQTTLAERAEAKAERLDALAEKRARQANAYQSAAHEYAKRFEFGQPILVGHHSEKSARKAAERRDSAMTKAVAASRAVNYWRDRAAGVEGHANRKNAPGVRARRIKTLLAELRDFQRTINKMEKRRGLWQCVENNEQAIALANHSDFSLYETWGELQDGKKDWQTARSENIDIAERYLRPDSNCRRCIEHTLNRLGYERELLGPVPQFEGELTPVILQVFARTHGAEKPKAEKIGETFKLTSPVNLPAHLSLGKSLELTATAWRDLMQSCGYEVPEKKAAPRRKGPSAPLVNPTREDAERLQEFWNNDAKLRSRKKHGGRLENAEVLEITQKVYSENSKGTYSPFSAADLDAHGRKIYTSYYGGERQGPPVALRLRSGPGAGQMFSAYSVIHLADKPGNPLPIDWSEADRVKAELAELEAQENETE